MVSVKDNSVPFDLDDDHEDYIEWMLKIKMSALGYLQALDNGSSDIFIRNVVTNQCKKMKDVKLNMLCTDMVRLDRDRFLASAPKLLDAEYWTKDDFKLAFYIYAYYKTQGAGLDRFLNNDFLAVYVKSFLSRRLCACYVAKLFDKYLNSVDSYYAGEKVPPSDLGPFADIVTKQSYSKYKEFKQNYF